jgi:asparagine synthase (glutamine-hydrolysing)
MLNGQGGDEVLLGYERYFAAFLTAVPARQVIREMFAQARNSRLSLREVLAYRLYFTNAALRIRRLKSRSFLQPRWQAACDLSAVRESARSFRDLDELQIHEIATLQLPHLLRYEDRNSMRHSIETRLPFLDYRFVEFGISIPPGHKIRDGWTKYVLRRAMQDVLPPEVTWRRDKLGFQAPERTWLTAARELTDRSRLLAEYDRLPLGERWRYFMLAIWAREFGVTW